MDVKVRLECFPVANGLGSQTVSGCGQSTSSCYKRLTHSPAGLKGSSDSNWAKGFRLGDIYHGNCRLDYCGTTTVRPGWAPPVAVTAYFYNEDKTYCDPLLVELVFAKVTSNGVQGQNGLKEYYYLKERNGDNGNRPALQCPPTRPDTSTRYATASRKCSRLIFSITEARCKFEINGATTNGKKIGVKECKCSGCVTLTKSEALRDKQHFVGGLVFTLPVKNGAGAKNGDLAIEIPLYGWEGQSCGQPELCTGTGSAGKKNGSTKVEITYTTCKGNLFVFF
ncbi:hypothetical protein MACJ_002465 [Theileria orientalis]|uniref:Uncharacterized protein n=1 Tax=Theileria orientalis TaxID=68886 RepID=A0A976QSC6_THEOR|nr:hypothetical protein MACJ_002465 [Theileria orientalis]